MYLVRLKSGDQVSIDADAVADHLSTKSLIFVKDKKQVAVFDRSAVDAYWVTTSAK